VHVEQITSRVWTVQHDDVNTGFVATGAGAVVFDTGSSSEQGRRLRELVTSTTGEDVAFVVNSHYHQHHCGGNGAFDGTFLFHRQSFERMTNKGRSCIRNPKASQVIFSRDGFLKVGDVFLELRQASGHAPGSLVMTIPGERVAFTGDLLFVGRVPTSTHSDLRVWAAEMVWLAQLPVDVWVPGHGDLGDRDAVGFQRQYLEGLISATTLLKRAGRDVEDMLARGEVPSLGADPCCPHHRRNVERAFRQVA